MAKHTITAWSPEEDARLRGLWDEGHSTAEIARRMGRTKNSVVGRVHRLAFPARPSPIQPKRPISVAPARIRRNSAAEVRAAWARQKQHQQGATRAPVQPGRWGIHPGLAALPIPAEAGDPGRSGPAGMVDLDRATGRSSLTLPPAEAIPRLGVFSGRQDEGCRWPMWGHAERPTQVFCCGPRWVREDGTKAAYCDRHAARAFTRTFVAEPVVITRRTFAWGGRAA